jgi:hypothetical protein
VETQEVLAGEFELHRPHLRAVAYRMLARREESMEERVPDPIVSDVADRDQLTVLEQ